MTKTHYPCLPVENWPPPDRDLWKVALEPVDLFEEGSPASEWSPDTRIIAADAYGQYLSYLQVTGTLDPHATPLERTGEAQVRAFIEAFKVGRSEITVAMTLYGVASVVRACHPPNGHPWLTTLSIKMRKRAKPQRSLHARSATIDELLWVGETLLRKGRKLMGEGDFRSGAVAFRDGLIILTLTVDPLRRRNLSNFQLGKTLVIENQSIRSRYSRPQTKTKKTHDRTFPAWLVADYMEYLEAVRPHLLTLAEQADEGWMWIGRNGTRMRAQSFQVITTKHTRDLLGRAVPPHNFRHSTASDVARLDPSNVHIAADILDHTSFRTTRRYYIMARSFDAHGRFDDIVERRRGECR